MKNKKLLQAKRDNELKRLRLEKSKRLATINSLRNIRRAKKLRLILETKLENL